MTARSVALVAAGATAVVLASKKGRKRVQRSVDIYVEELSSGSRPLDAVGTSIAAFIGLAPGGPINVP